MLGVPEFMVDGIILQAGGMPHGSLIDRYLPLVESRLRQVSPLIMAGSYTVSGSTVTMAVNIEVDVPVRTLDNRVEFFVCQEGLYEQSNMVVDMLAPEPFTLTEKGETVTVQRQFTLDPAWSAEALRLVVIVQDRETKEVLQSALAVEDETSAAKDPAPRVAAVLRPAYPNPFNPRTNLEFNLEQPGFVRFEIYDARGLLVRQLLAEHRDAGPHNMQWDGSDATGLVVAAGTYFARLRTDERVLTCKLTLAK
jgi:hypothetical protein